jgi:hypothetical protein
MTEEVIGAATREEVESLAESLFSSEIFLMMLDQTRSGPFLSATGRSGTSTCRETITHSARRALGLSSSVTNEMLKNACTSLTGLCSRDVRSQWS